MRVARSIILTTAFTAVVLVDAGPAVAAPQKCHGRPATIVGTKGADNLFGTRGRDVMVGKAGDDFILPRGGNDLVCAGDDSDVIHGGKGNDKVLGGEGDDTLVGNAGIDELRGQTDVDVLFGDAGNDQLFAGSGVGLGSEGLIGGAGDDLLNGGPGLDSAQFFDSPRGVQVDLDAGTATGRGTDQLVRIEGAGGSNFNDTISGDEGTNGLFGQEGNDTIVGRDSGTLESNLFDVLSGDGGDDDIQGGLGFDFVTFGREPLAATVDLDAGTATGHGSDTLADIEGAIGSVEGDVLRGDALDNAFVPGEGDDQVDGRDGEDTVIYRGGSRGVLVDLAAREASGAGTDEVLAMENAWGTLRADLLMGDARSNELIGFNGSDGISAGAGDDLLDGGAGRDNLNGGDDIDTCLDGETAIDCESFTAAAAATAGGGFLSWFYDLAR
jgi:Ca2+-binding RTX toxin-like protein